MAVRKTHAPRPDVRELLIREHEATVLRWAIQLGADGQAESSRRWIEHVRAGNPIYTVWWQLPEGALPLGGHTPNDAVVLGADDTVSWAEPGPPRGLALVEVLAPVTTRAGHQYGPPVPVLMKEDEARELAGKGLVRISEWPQG